MTATGAHNDGDGKPVTDLFATFLAGCDERCQPRDGLLRPTIPEVANISAYGEQFGFAKRGRAFQA